MIHCRVRACPDRLARFRRHGMRCPYKSHFLGLRDNIKSMKKILTIIALVLVCMACDNKSTVNILIANEHNSDTTNVVVNVAVEEIMQHVNAQSVDSLTLLNEKNQPVAFTSDGKNIQFTIPVIQARSQKNYSLNTGNPSLSDNLFSFRTTSINVEL